MIPRLLKTNVDTDSHVEFFRNVLMKKTETPNVREVTIARFHKKDKATQEISEKLLEVIELLRKSEKHIPSCETTDLEPIIGRIVEDGFFDGVTMQETTDKCLEAIARIKGNVETANKRLDYFILAGYGLFLKLRIRYAKELRNQDVEASKRMAKLSEKIKILKEENSALKAKAVPVDHGNYDLRTVLKRELLNTNFQSEDMTSDLNSQVALLENVLYYKTNLLAALDPKASSVDTAKSVKSIHWKEKESILKSSLQQGTGSKSLKVGPLTYSSRTNVLPSKRAFREDLKNEDDGKEIFHIDMNAMFSHTLDEEFIESPSFLDTNEPDAHGFKKAEISSTSHESKIPTVEWGCPGFEFESYTADLTMNVATLNVSDSSPLATPPCMNMDSASSTGQDSSETLTTSSIINQKASLEDFTESTYHVVN